jgi:hypothetical protein
MPNKASGGIDAVPRHRRRAAPRLARTDLLTGWPRRLFALAEVMRAAMTGVPSVAGSGLNLRARVRGHAEADDGVVGLVIVVEVPERPSRRLGSL